MSIAASNSAPPFPRHRVDFGAVIPWKNGILQSAFERFASGEASFLREEFQQFSLENASWLDDFALFMAIKQAHGGGPWTNWEPALIRRDASVLESWSDRLEKDIERRRFDQFLFFRQWGELREYAHERGIHIIVDMPIFVAHDSADVWAQCEEG